MNHDNQSINRLCRNHYSYTTLRNAKCCFFSIVDMTHDRSSDPHLPRSWRWRSCSHCPCFDPLSFQPLSRPGMFWRHAAWFQASLSIWQGDVSLNKKWPLEVLRSKKTFADLTTGLRCLNELLQVAFGSIGLARQGKGGFNISKMMDGNSWHLGFLECYSNGIQP